MRNVWFACLFVLLVSPMSVASGEPVVTSEKLTAEDVKGYLSRQDWRTLVEFYGIHQEGSRATVYYKGKQPVPPFVDKNGFDMIESTLDLVRFNSGKWFVITDGTFLTK